jgi:hypothetical protein
MDGTLTGQSLQQFVRVIYQTIMENSVGPGKTNEVSHNLEGQVNQTEQYVNELVRNGTTQAESQITGQLGNGLVLAEEQLDQLYEKLKHEGFLGWAGTSIASSLFGINRGVDIIPPEQLQKFQGEGQQRALVKQALNLLISKSYGNDLTVEDLQAKGQPLTPEDIVDFSVQISMMVTPKNQTLGLSPNVTMQVFSVVEPTMYYIGFYWSKFGTNALYFIFACCNVMSQVFVLYLAGRMIRKYHKLMEQMQEGSFNEYPVEEMQNSFSYCTYLPGTFVFTALLAYLVFYFVLFVTMALLITFIVLLFIPNTRIAMWDSTLPWITYFGIYAVIIYGVKYVLIEWYCIEDGEVIHPHVLSVCLTILMVYNFVVGTASSLFRMQFIMTYATIMCFFIDETTLPSSLLEWDPGYYAFLASTYTWYERMNPIKKSFTTLLMPSAHMTDKPENAAALRVIDGEITSSKLPVRARRVQNKFNLALTLFRNPELRPLRWHYLRDIKEGTRNTED